MAKAVVLIGAGASYDCASPDVRSEDARKPPLVTQLFEEKDYFAGRLHLYPLAEAAAPDIRRTVGQGSIAIEDFLRSQLRDSKDPFTLRRYRQVPLYLQHLLYDISKDFDQDGYTRHPDNYDALISAALEILDDVIFVSLNYDTLLDDRLFIYSRDSVTLDSYIPAGEKWCLIKLHGSVNWGRPANGLTDHAYNVDIQTTNRLFGEPAELELGEVVLRGGHRDVAAMRYESQQLFYPAVSVPLGSEDELSCPEPHQEHLRDRLKNHERLNLLVVGYSGADKSALAFLRDAGLSFGRMLVVNGAQEASLAAAQKIKPTFGQGAGLEEEAFADGFTEFVQSGAHRDFFGSLN